MTDLPISFIGAMIRATLDGRKTMTRRLAYGEERHPVATGAEIQALEEKGWRIIADDDGIIALAKPSRWAKVKLGDRLWVREAWRTAAEYDTLSPKQLPHDAPILTLAEDQIEPLDTPVKWGRYRHARFMPRWASRFTLIVESVKVERLQDISEEDAIAEGILRGDPMPEIPYSYGTVWHDGVTDPMDGWTRDPTEAFMGLWSAIHGPDAWDANPWVAAIGFRAIKANIDAIEREGA